MEKKPSAKKQAKLAQKAREIGQIAALHHAVTKARLERLSQSIESTCELLNGGKLAATMKAGVFTWALDGKAISVEEAKVAMESEPRDSWIFKSADGRESMMRRATPRELELDAKAMERAEWNAAVEKRRARA